MQKSKSCNNLQNSLPFLVAENKKLRLSEYVNWSNKTISVTSSTDGELPTVPTNSQKPFSTSTALVESPSLVMNQILTQDHSATIVALNEKIHSLERLLKSKNYELLQKQVWVWLDLDWVAFNLKFKSQLYFELDYKIVPQFAKMENDNFGKRHNL